MRKQAPTCEKSENSLLPNGSDLPSDLWLEVLSLVGPEEAFYSDYHFWLGWRTISKLFCDIITQRLDLSLFQPDVELTNLNPHKILQLFKFTRMNIQHTTNLNFSLLTKVKSLSITKGFTALGHRPRKYFNATSPLSQLTQLTELSIEGKIHEPNLLLHFTGLKNLKIINSFQTEEIETLTNLEILKIRGIHVENLGNLTNLQFLSFFYVSGIKPSDINWLTKLKNIQTNHSCFLEKGIEPLE
jgi:hypothetical protein